MGIGERSCPACFFLTLSVPAERMARLFHHQRNFRGWIVLVASISTLTQFIALSHQRRRRYRALHVADLHVDHLVSMTTRNQQSLTAFMNKLTSILVVLAHEDSSGPKRLLMGPWYIKPRTPEWFYLFSEGRDQFDADKFQQFFRITPQLFAEICDLVREDLVTDPPFSLTTLPNRVFVVERQVAIAIRRLATGDSLLGIAELFGISVTSASKATWRFIESFIVRGRHFIGWPEGRDMDVVKAGFQDRWGLPNCCGAIDCTHFLIELPHGEHSTAYYDWKQNLSITMQAVVDVNGKFLDVLIGNPGSTQDSRLLRLSNIFRDVVYEGTKLNGPEYMSWNGQGIPEYILGDAGYPLYKWLIVPYPRNLSINTDRWNTLHSSARMCVERSFGKLKGVWRILSRQLLRPKLERMAPTVFACVLLHNLMMARGVDAPQVVWADMPAHPPGYARQNRPSTAFFEGGQLARDLLVVQTQDRLG